MRVFLRILFPIFCSVVFLQILSSHLEDFFDSKVLNAKWSPLDFNIIVPQTNRIQDYFGMATQLPDTTQPEMFGLSKLTNLSKDLIFCRNLLKDLRSSYFHVKDNENFEKRVRPILSLWKKLIQVGVTMHNLFF